MLIPLSILSSISIKEKRYNVVLPILHFVITQGILLFIQIKNFIKPIKPMYQLTKKQQEVFATHGIIVYCVTTIATFIPLLAFLLDLNKTYARIDKMNEDLKYTATHDHLTGLINRHSIQEYFEEALTNYNTNNKPFSVILADIDNFKKVNDTYGHTAGDLVLQGVSYIMKSSVSNTDFVCRWGGEEILILTYTDLDSAIALAEKIRESISHATFISEEVEINVTITSGIATYKSNSSIDEIIQLADTNLYKGKNSTKNCVIS
jgi:diguanylate cyclase (GGDEF)-like protein